MKLYHVHEVAKICDLHLMTVYKLIREGKITAVKLGRRNIRVSEQSLNDWLKSCEIKKD